MTKGPAPRPLAERFWEKVDTSGDCWVWTGCRNRLGYGRFFLGNQTVRNAHRVAYEITHGEIDPGKFVCHRCDNPPCVRPDHLFLGTHLDNMTDMRVKGRSAIGERNGMNAHPERRARGDCNGARLHPDRVPRGDRNGSRIHPEAYPRGERHRCARLTTSAVIEIRQMYVDGSPRAVIAAKFGIRLATVYKIGGGRVWKHLLPQNESQAEVNR